MDWARAKSIIIFLLAALNIFLFVYILGYIRDQGVSAATLQNTEKILKLRGIDIECAIPRYNGTIPKLLFDDSGPDIRLLAGKLLGSGYGEDGAADTYINGSRKLSFDSAGILTYSDTAPSDMVNVKSARSMEKYVRDFLTDKGMIDSSYILDENSAGEDGSTTLVFIQEYKGFLVYGNYVKATVTGKGITGIVMHGMRITGLSAAGKDDKMVAAYQVLLANFDRNGVVITDMDLGYKDDGGAASTQQLSVWRVKVRGASVPMYFSTVDGKEIK